MQCGQEAGSSGYLLCRSRRFSYVADIHHYNTKSKDSNGNLYANLSARFTRTMVNRPNRRSFLTLTSVSATAAIAGCSDLNSIAQDGSDGGGSDGPLTIQVQPDQEELQSLQEDLQAEVEAGETEQAEATAELETRQAELTEEAASAYEKATSNDDSISVEDIEAEYGILRVSAPADSLVEDLKNGEIGGILPAAYYDQFLDQQERQEQQQELREQIENQQESANETNGSSETENESSG